MDAENGIREDFLEEVISDSSPLPIFQALHSCSLISTLGALL